MIWPFSLIRRRRQRRAAAAYQWAKQFNDIMNTLPQWQQDQLDARIRDKVVGA